MCTYNLEISPKLFDRPNSLVFPFLCMRLFFRSLSSIILSPITDLTGVELNAVLDGMCSNVKLYLFVNCF